MVKSYYRVKLLTGRSRIDPWPATQTCIVKPDRYGSRRTRVNIIYIKPCFGRVGNTMQANQFALNTMSYYCMEPQCMEAPCRLLRSPHYFLLHNQCAAFILHEKSFSWKHFAGNQPIALKPHENPLYSDSFYMKILCKQPMVLILHEKNLQTTHGMQYAHVIQTA